MSHRVYKNAHPNKTKKIDYLQAFFYPTPLQKEGSVAPSDRLVNRLLSRPSAVVSTLYDTTLYPCSIMTSRSLCRPQRITFTLLVDRWLRFSHPLTKQHSECVPSHSFIPSSNIQHRTFKQVRVKWRIPSEIELSIIFAFFSHFSCVCAFFVVPLQPI
jgi:hypothetical protein